jgi:hypothetical protein
MTLTEELRAAAKALREPHTNTLDCVALLQKLQEAREPLAEWLESIAAEAERHEAQGWGNDQSEIADGHPLAVARIFTGGAS